MTVCESGDLCDGEAVESTTFPGVFRFCGPHQGQLDEIAQELRDGAWDRNVRNKESVNERYCSTPWCHNRPVYGGDYCPDCNGWD